MAEKLTINMVAMGNLRHRKKRYVSLVIGILLAMVFSSGVPFFIDCMNASMEECTKRMIGRQDAILVGAENIELGKMQADGAIQGKIGRIHILGYGQPSDSSEGIPIGSLDDTAAELYYLQCLEGRMPENPGEIAVEKSVLMRLFPGAKPGDSLTFHMRENEKADIKDGSTIADYQLVGVLDNRRSCFEGYMKTNLAVSNIPGAFTVAAENSVPEDSDMILLEYTNRSMDLHDYFENGTVLNTDTAPEYSSSTLEKRGRPSAMISALLAFLSCFAVANTFYANLKERKQQIGMLRALGATKRQILILYGREAFLLALICCPVGMLLAWAGVWGFTKVYNGEILFIPTLSILLRGGLVSLTCVMLAALIPLLAVVGIPPIQAIRNAEMMRTAKRMRMHSEKDFRVPSLVASRNMAFHKGRQIIISVILASTMLVCCMVGTLIQPHMEENTVSWLDSSYRVNLTGYYFGENCFENEETENEFIPQSMLNQVKAMPQIRSADGYKICQANLLIKGEYPRYLSLMEYEMMTNSRYEDAGLGCSHQGLTKENYREILESQFSPEYLKLKNEAGYEEELFNIHLNAETESQLERAKKKVVEGEINVQKLNSGEEILLAAPKKIAYVTDECPHRPIAGILNLEQSETQSRKLEPYMLETAECPFHAGDTLKVSILYRDESGYLTRSDREMKIGAILQSDDLLPISLKTSVAGLDHFSLPIDYYGINIEPVGQLTPEEDLTLVKELETMFPDMEIDSMQQFLQGRRARIQRSILVLISMISVLLTVCISLVNHGVTAQVRDGQKSIGTMRAVGASDRMITACYGLQILYVTGAGTALGTLISIFYALLEKYAYGNNSLQIALWPVFSVAVMVLGFGFLNLMIQLRKVGRHSIVENIREL